MKKFCIKIKHATSLALTAALVFYQLFLPFTLIEASADTNSGTDSLASTPSSTSASAGGQDDNNSNENSNSNENDNKPTCDVKNSELTDFCQEKLDCDDIDKCLIKNTCSEIKKCLVVEVENKNETEVNNNVNSSSDTGKNEIIQESDNCNENSNDNENANSNGNSNENENSNENTNSNNEEILNQVQDDSNSNSNDNTGDPSSTAPASAETTAGEQDDNEAEIDTGDAVATSDVYNEVNTNIVSDNYQQTTINIDGTYNGDINLLEQFEEVAANDTETETGSLTVTNENNAKVTNDIDVTANSGENTIETTGGESSIQTGDAGALSNTVNVVNTNIVGNNVLFVVVNVYGEWNGDLIVPGEGLLEVSPEPVYSETVIVNENDADIENNVSVAANTGENAIEQEGSGNNTALIETGASLAASEVVNIVNTNIVKNNFFFLMINNLGSWTGKILNWNEESESYSNIFTYDFGLLPDGESPTIDGLLAIFNKNTAKVENNVNVSANTGGNSIETGGGSASIQTGNAAAMAKIINFINTNIVGNNWIFAIVNVMGQWNGNAVFAYPDLSIAISDGRDQVNPGESINYQVTYKNNGKAACDNANVLVSLPPYVSSNGSLNFSLAGLKPGEEKSFAISAVVSGDIPEGNTGLETLAGINTGTKEVELGNNMGKDQTTAYRSSLAPAGLSNTENNGAGEDKNNPGLTITRDAKDDRVHAGKTVTYNIYIKNTGDVSLHDVLVFDEMKLESKTMANFTWNVGDVKPGQKFRIQYKLAINPLAPPGVYRSTASGYGFDSEDNKVNANKDSQRITVLGNEVNNVANDSTYYTQNLFQYGDSVITGGICFLDEWPVLNQANAADNQTFLAASESDNAAPSLPFWVWLAAALSYFLMVNWSLFPKKKELLPGTELGMVNELVPEEELTDEDLTFEEEVELETENYEQKNN